MRAATNEADVGQKDAIEVGRKSDRADAGVDHRQGADAGEQGRGDRAEEVGGQQLVVLELVDSIGKLALHLLRKPPGPAEDGFPVALPLAGENDESEDHGDQRRHRADDEEGTPGERGGETTTTTVAP